MIHIFKSLGAALAVAALSLTPLLAQTAPKPKSQKEVDALRAIQNAQTNDARLKAIENVLDNFADTDYKVMLLTMGMQLAEQSNNYVATVNWAERLLDADPKNVFATATLAAEIARHTREHDLDKAEQLAKVRKYAKATIDNVPTAPKLRPDITDEQWASLKKDISAQAYEAMGMADALDDKYDAAVQDYKQAQDTAASPDPATYVRMGDAYMHLSKYDDAIAAFDKAANAPNAQPQVKQVAAAKKADAEKMKGAGAKPATGAAAAGTAGAAAPAQVDIKH